MSRIVTRADHELRHHRRAFGRSQTTDMTRTPTDDRHHVTHALSRRHRCIPSPGSVTPAVTSPGHAHRSSRGSPSHVRRLRTPLTIFSPGRRRLHGNQLAAAERAAAGEGRALPTAQGAAARGAGLSVRQCQTSVQPFYRGGRERRYAGVARAGECALIWHAGYAGCVRSACSYARCMQAMALFA